MTVPAIALHAEVVHLKFWPPRAIEKLSVL
jgi:hypothetical protein